MYRLVISHAYIYLKIQCRYFDLHAAAVIFNALHDCCMHIKILALYLFFQCLYADTWQLEPQYIFSNHGIIQLYIIVVYKLEFILHDLKDKLTLYRL